MRVGLGFDLHRLVKKRKLFLGGVPIPYSKGLLGHSDGDVVIHSVCDAILGATGLQDIGEYFPDTDKKIKGIGSKVILKKVLQKFSLLKIENIDIIVIAEEPKLSKFKNNIKESIAKLLGIKKEQVAIKAKTMEGIGIIGEKQAIACFCVVLIDKFKLDTTH